MNTELQKLLIEILCHKEDIIDMDTCYDAEFDGLMDLLDDILSNDIEKNDF